jgi:hypothetical protein
MRELAIAVLISFVGAAASAATLTVTADKSTYSIGETITLSIVGDSEGEKTHYAAVGGTLLFDDTLVSWVSTVQQPLTSFNGGLTWVLGAVVSKCLLPNDVGPGCPAIAQIGGLMLDVGVDGPLLSTMTLSAEAAGTVDITWQVDDPSEALIFFDMTDAPGTSFTIINPEPGTMGLLALGLVGLAIARRRRAL